MIPRLPGAVGRRSRGRSGRLERCSASGSRASVGIGDSMGMGAAPPNPRGGDSSSVPGFLGKANSCCSTAPLRRDGVGMGLGRGPAEFPALFHEPDGSCGLCQASWHGSAPGFPLRRGRAIPPQGKGWEWLRSSGRARPSDPDPALPLPAVPAGDKAVTEGTRGAGNARKSLSRAGSGSSGTGSQGWSREMLPHIPGVT